MTRHRSGDLRQIEDILIYSKLVRSLIKAAHALRHKKHSAVTIKKEELFHKKYYCSHYVSADVWQEFPRCLSEKEYRDPYRVFQQFSATGRSANGCSVGSR